ncbi:MAG: DUF6580 family putative transport protein [Verrucomicrobiota bacterium]
MKRYLPLLLIVTLLLLFRVAGIVFPEALPNFQPLVAVFFCGALLAPGWRGFALPFGIWAITYPFGVGPVHSLPLFITTLAALSLIAFMGRAAAGRGVPTLLVGSIVSAVVFHLITSGAAWIAEPLYPKNAEGLWQSVWSGPVGYGPSWVFLRNLAAVNFIFTAVFLLARVRLPKSEAAPHSSRVFAR